MYCGRAVVTLCVRCRASRITTARSGESDQAVQKSTIADGHDGWTWHINEHAGNKYVVE